jgi:CheY-like chemotaxis protein
VCERRKRIGRPCPSPPKVVSVEELEHARSSGGRRSGMAEYVRKGLEEEGHVVQVCFDGAAGLKAAELTAFDIIVLDDCLP